MDARTEHESLLRRLNKEAGIEDNKIDMLSDYALLCSINVLLIKNDCIPYTQEELWKPLRTHKKWSREKNPIPDEPKQKFERPKAEYSNKNFFED